MIEGRKDFIAATFRRKEFTVAISSVWHGEGLEPRTVPFLIASSSFKMSLSADLPAVLAEPGTTAVDRYAGHTSIIMLELVARSHARQAAPGISQSAWRHRRSN